MTLEKANENEAEQLVEISVAAFDSDVEVGSEGKGGPPQYDDLSWHREMAQRGHLFAAKDNDKIVGGALLFTDERDKTFLYVGRIFVAPSEFRRGYGIAIMQGAESAFEGKKHFALDTPIWNIRTNSFYKKLGYKEVRRDEEFIYYEKRLK